MSDDASPSPGAGISVLICDDNEQIRALLRAVIESCTSLRVVGEASDGNEAIVEAALHQPNVILLDLAMPHRTGLEALPGLSQVAPGARIIVFSGFAAEELEEEVLKLGAVRYLQKGSSAEAILDAIEEAAAEGVPRSLVTDTAPT